tara:strand:+ start:481 stop:720 length:240 start_codon:yes stop_codon:yes gene_type:complete
MRETPNLNKRLVCRPDSYGLSGALTTAELYDIIYVSVSEQLYGTPREKLNGLNPRIIYSWREIQPLSNKILTPDKKFFG